MKTSLLAFTCFLPVFVHAASDPASVVPQGAPRTWVLPSSREGFKAYCTTGDGAKPFARIRDDLDRRYMAMPFPAEPMTYGDPSPSKRDSDKADKWRNVQDICGRVTGVAEAATLCWIITGEDKYYEKARSFLLQACAWHFAPDWKSGSVVGATDIEYNDEGDFRLWRKLPEIYDQLRGRLSAEDKQAILASFKVRGDRTVAWIRKAKVQDIRRNSLEIDADSHPVRFMAMTGLGALALWDDLPEAKAWWNFAYVFYRDQFSPWGGDDGGWAEGNAYWRGTFEHAEFQDTLLAIGDPQAYSSAFWKNSPYFALYNVQPYLHTIFGDTSNAGHFDLEPVVADYMEHVARVEGNGYFRSYAALCEDKRPRPIDKGMAGLDRSYPTATEFLVRNFIASGRTPPAPKPLAELPLDRYFKDVGWVSMHSALGRPADDIQITFVSSPYGSFSHSHGHQDAFILNAYGESLAINSAYREFHRSPFHKGWTWQTKSKNDILIDGLGQKPQDKQARGKITRFESSERTVWTTGDATEAYQTLQPSGRVERVTRDLVFVDRRYVVIRDRVELATPGKLSWLLHSESSMAWEASTSTAFVRQHAATLTTSIVSPGVEWKATVTDKFPIPVDPKYAEGGGDADYVTAKWTNQWHFTAESTTAAKSFTVYAVLWPERSGTKPAAIAASLSTSGILLIHRPDGKSDEILLTDDSLSLH